MTGDVRGSAKGVASMRGEVRGAWSCAGEMRSGEPEVGDDGARSANDGCQMRSGVPRLRSGEPDVTSREGQVGFEHQGTARRAGERTAGRDSGCGRARPTGSRNLTNVGSTFDAGVFCQEMIGEGSASRALLRCDAYLLSRRSGNPCRRYNTTGRASNALECPARLQPSRLCSR